MSPRSLDAYRQKRDSAKTPEPFGPGPVASAPGNSAGRFVVQQHAARRMHWDLRLEIDGVLVSWAVPRGPSVDLKEKRLAVQTEDHPLEYAGFEGIIPKGNYGAGPMIVWDAGHFRTVDDSSGADGLRAGKLDLELSGYKLLGRWALVRTKGSDGKEWLLFKKPGGSAGTSEPVVAQPASVFSGLTIDELRDGARRDSELAAAAAAAGVPRRALGDAALSPMLAETADAAFSRAGWLFELKYDGIRVLIVRQAGRPVRLLARSGRDITETFPDVIATAAHLPADSYVVDGELIAPGEHGTGSFEHLQQRLGLTNRWDVARAAVEHPVQVYGFDLLAATGYDLRGMPLAARKTLLRRLLPAAGMIRYADHLDEHGTMLFEEACKHGVEGIIGKRADSLYSSGRRSRDWLKVKVPATAELAVVGFVAGKGRRAALGALMLAWRRGGEFVYAGNVGSGLTQALIEALLPVLRAATRSTPAFIAADPPTRGAMFVEPRLVAEVRFTDATQRGLLRQPVFVRICEDKRCDEADAEPARRSASRVEASAPRAPMINAEHATPIREGDAARFAPVNVDKLFWPRDGYTKGDLLAYYDTVWPAIAPYLRDRPLVLTRYPDGIDGKSFFQKNAPEFIPDWIETCRIDDTAYFVCNESEALRYVINLGCIPLHVWSARRQSLDRPDWAILDLDPKEAPFRDVLAVACRIHALLEPLAVPHFIKTSGQDGLHVLIPLGGALTHDETKSFAEVLARLVVAELPDIATIVRPLGGRAGKVYVDFLQNGFGKTLVAPFSVRPRTGAPVSTPLLWSEVTPRLSPPRFTIETVPGRLAKQGDPMRAVLDTAADIPALLQALVARQRE
jgi:bifunctional non-homologous end joining protein LigD